MTEEYTLVIDVQGFYFNKEFIAKEVSISTYDSHVTTFLIQPPFEESKLTIQDKTTNNWLYYNHHGLKWEDGDSTLMTVIEYIHSLKKRKNCIFYAKGLEKIRWIQRLFGYDTILYNLDDLNCPNLKNLYNKNININTCKFHKNSMICAEKNVIILRKFISSLNI